MAKYIFKEDYEAKGANLIPKGSQMASVILKYSFKKGDVFEGDKSIVGGGGEDDGAVQYAIHIVTPSGITTDGTIYNGKAEFDYIPDMVVTEQHGLGADYPDNTDVAPQTFLQKHKNHLLIVGAIVIGYLAYKKFKK